MRHRNESAWAECKYVDMQIHRRAYVLDSDSLRDSNVLAVHDILCEDVQLPPLKPASKSFVLV